MVRFSEETLDQPLAQATIGTGDEDNDRGHNGL